MRLILLDPLRQAENFYPLALSRPIWELRCGMSRLAAKLVGQARRDRRGLLRAALHGRRLPRQDAPGRSTTSAAWPATTCCWSTAA